MDSKSNIFGAVVNVEYTKYSIDHLYSGGVVLQFFQSILCANMQVTAAYIFLCRRAFPRHKDRRFHTHSVWCSPPNLHSTFRRSSHIAPILTPLDVATKAFFFHV